MKINKAVIAPLKDFRGSMTLDMAEVFADAVGMEKQHLAENYLEKNKEQISKMLADAIVNDALIKVSALPAKKMRVNFLKNGKYRRIF